MLVLPLNSRQMQFAADKVERHDGAMLLARWIRHAISMEIEKDGLILEFFLVRGVGMGMGKGMGI